MAELLSKGITAPDLTVNVALGQKPSRHGLRGNPIVLAFCPADWSSFCEDQVMLYNETLPDLQKYDSEVLVHGVMPLSQKTAICIFPLVPISNPKSRSRDSAGPTPAPKDGFREPALLVIDLQGIILKLRSDCSKSRSRWRSKSMGKTSEI